MYTIVSVEPATKNFVAFTNRAKQTLSAHHCLFSMSCRGGQLLLCTVLTYLISLYMNNVWNTNKELRGNMLVNDTMNLNWICINMIMYKYLLLFDFLKYCLE